MTFSIDVGGTFTDVGAVSGSEIRTVKVSTDYSAIYDALVGGAKELGLENGTIFNHASTRPECRDHPQAPQDRHPGNSRSSRHP